MDINGRKERMGAAIARIRASRQLTQRDLAEMVGTGQSVIWRIEQGTVNCKVDTLLKIADALDCKMSDFVDF